MYSGKAIIASLRRVFPSCCQTCRLMRSNCSMNTCIAPAYYHSISSGYHTVTKRHYDHKRRTNPDVIPSAIHNVQSIKAKWAEKFTDMNISEPDVSAELIVAHVLGQKTLENVLPWQIVSRTKTDKINDLCSLRLKRMPVQYVIEEWDFRDLVLQMKPPVLIPRPETEELITHIKNYTVIQDLTEPNRIIDIGCGSGAIILSLAREFPSAYCIGVDKSTIACELTRKNANNHALIVHVENIDVTDQAIKASSVFNERYDLIVSNPPYIKSADLMSLQPEITKYEDVNGALHGGEEGLDIVIILLRNTRHIINPNGLLWLEVDSSHPELIKRLVEDNPEWQLKYIKTYKDFNEKPRFCLLKSPGP